ncbi:MAG: hypothetical protein ACYDD6_06105, partial [Acidimicrobiales bacterium]
VRGGVISPGGVASRGEVSASSNANGAPTTTAPATSAPPSNGAGTRLDISSPEAALRSYLAAVAAHSANAVVASSRGKAEALAAVLLDISVINASQGGTTTTTLQDPGFTLSSSSAGSATFTGSATWTSVVSGPKGGGTTTDTVSGPVVVTKSGNIWQVESFTFDDAPMTWWLENATETQGDLSVEVSFVLTYADTTVALIGLGAPTGNESATLQSVGLSTTSGASTGTWNFTPGREPTGVVDFFRTDATPTSMELKFSASSGGPVTFSIPLHGSPG